MFWYEDEVKRLEKERSNLTYKPATLFYGSSSIRMWSTLGEDFKGLAPINLGFGGSTLAACTWFFDRLVTPLDAQSIVVYAGDNDLADGRHPEELFIFFQGLADRVQKRYGDIPCYYISVKSSVARWNLADNIRYTNSIIENEIIKRDANWRFINIFNLMLDKNGIPDKKYFEGDGLHMNRSGYEIWKQAVLTKISENVHKELT